MYVHSEYRRRGHFRALYDYVQQQAREERAVGIRLYVDTHNSRAQETVRPLLDAVIKLRILICQSALPLQPSWMCGLCQIQGSALDGLLPGRACAHDC